MSLNRRDVIRATAGAVSVAMLPAVIRAQAQATDTPYGMIEIGSSGVLVSVYQFAVERIAGSDGASGFERFAPKRRGQPYGINASPLNSGGDEAAVAETVDAVAQAVAQLKGEIHIAPENIVIVASSGVSTFSPTLVEQLTKGIVTKTGYTLGAITPREEARLACDWIIPRQQRANVLQLDIGSGNTKGGYYEKAGSPQERFRDFSVAYGTRTMTAAIRKLLPSETDPKAFWTQAAKFYSESFAPRLTPQIDNAPGLLSKQSIYLSGGIVWAAALVTKPKEMATRGNWVKLGSDDFANLRRLIEAGTPYGAALPSSITPEQRTWLTKALADVRETFNPYQLAAGGALCEGLTRQLDFKGRQSVFFASFANNSWSSQYMVEKFGKHAAA